MLVTASHQLTPHPNTFSDFLPSSPPPLQVPDAIYQGTQEGGVASKGEVACSFSYSTDKEILTVNITEATYNLPAGSAGPANCYVKWYDTMIFVGAGGVLV